MREAKAFPALFLFFSAAVSGDGVPAGWTVVKDATGVCQAASPPEWTPLAEAGGAAVFRDSTTAILVVTSQPGQSFKPLSAPLLKVLDLRKEAVFENSVKRIFYQDKFSRDAESANAYSASVPGRNGTCSCRVTFLPVVSVEIAKKIALSLSAVP